jgi:hypothetical protein
VAVLFVRQIVLSLKIPVVEPVIETAGPAFPLLARRLIVDAFVIPFNVTLQVNCENWNVVHRSLQVNFDLCVCLSRLTRNEATTQTKT